ncbi:MAG: TonB-dependent receptor [Prolixibacteraceae bacterium]|nr:TonB-dependent receptor [Prolixibacteraceae bacterium]
MKKTVYTFSLLVSLTIGQAIAQPFTISGYVQSKESKEAIIGANVYNPASLRGTTTNQFGFFSFTTNEEKLKLHFSYVGFNAIDIDFSLTSDTMLNVLLEEGKKLDEILITQKSIQSSSFNPVSLTARQVELLPGLVGEVDILKAYQLRPGIAQGAEGSNGLYVRGGSPDQNLVLLDDVPLYYVSHIGGIVSIFDENSVKQLNVLKSGFPARYGGRLSSVVDFRMKDGNMEKYSGKVSVGIISSKLSVEGPIIKNKASFMFSLRKSMTDLFMYPISKILLKDNGSVIYSFYDFNGKINYKISDRDRVFLSFYNGQDRVRMNIQSEIDLGLETKGIYKTRGLSLLDVDDLNNWGNTMGCLRWNHVFGSKLFSNFTLAVSSYFYQDDSKNGLFEVENDKTIELFTNNFSSKIFDRLLKIDFDYYPIINHHVRFGLKTNYHEFTPGKLTQHYEYDVSYLDDSVSIINPDRIPFDTIFGSNTVNALESSVYVEDDMTLTDKINMNLGVHVASYMYDETSFLSVQPRFSLKYAFGADWTLSGSYVKMAQYIHLLTEDGTNMPADIWVPVTKNAPPEYSDQFSVGLCKEFQQSGIHLTVEGYYKTLENLIDYKIGENLVSGKKSWDKKIETGGTGEVYGLEFLIEKTKGKLTGWIGYTLSKNTRRFENINQGNSYPYTYDRPHDLSIVANYRINKNISISATWVYNSGKRVTMGQAYSDAINFFSSADIEKTGNVLYNSEFRHNYLDLVNETAAIYDIKNNYKMPDYHKLDVSVHFTKKKRHGERTWMIGVQNLYNRMNAYSLYYSENEDGTVSLKKLTIFPILPSISYCYRF